MYWRSCRRRPCSSSSAYRRVNPGARALQVGGYGFLTHPDPADAVGVGRECGVYRFGSHGEAGSSHDGRGNGSPSAAHLMSAHDFPAEMLISAAGKTLPWRETAGRLFACQEGRDRTTLEVSRLQVGGSIRRLYSGKRSALAGGPFLVFGYRHSKKPHSSGFQKGSVVKSAGLPEERRQKMTATSFSGMRSEPSIGPASRCF